MAAIVDVHIGCRCLNVQVTGHARAEDVNVSQSIASSSNPASGEDVGSSEKANTLARDIKLLSADTASGAVVQIAMPALTSRVMPLPSQKGSNDRTALVCLNCDVRVYAVDKAVQNKASRNARSTGFAIGPSSSVVPQSAQMAGPASEQQDIVQQPLLPDADGGSLWALAGCVYGSASIHALCSSADYSKSFKMVVKIPAEQRMGGVVESANAGDDARPTREDVARRSAGGHSDLRTDSPQRAFDLLAPPSHRRSGSSPSPARRRKTLTSAEEEEERGDDLDTLHLLETLLPHLPASLTNDAKPYLNGDPSAASIARRAVPTESPARNAHRSPDKGGSSIKLFNAKLDEQGIALLRGRLREVQNELYQLLKARSRELVHEESRLRKEAMQLKDRYARSASKTLRRETVQSKHVIRDPSAPASQQVQSGIAEGAGGADASLYAADDGEAGQSTSPTVFLRRRPYVPVMERSTSQDSEASKRTLSAGVGAVGVPGREAGGQNMANNVGSYLSASFAMRGRDLPGKKGEAELRSREDEEDWFAHKKRLRERYPHGDHSALPSAVNSDDEETVAVKARDELASSDSEDEQRRGRGRGRSAQQQQKDGGHHQSQKTPTPPRRREIGAVKDEGRKAIDSDTGSSAGEELSQSGKRMRGALKRLSNTTNDERVVAPTEKKVAFASTTEEHKLAPDAHAERSPSRAPVEPVEPLFEIDEDIDDADEASPSSSDITVNSRSLALQGGKQDLVEDAIRDEKEGLMDEDEEAETAEDMVAQETNLAFSMPIAGSFSVMAESESRRASIAAGLPPPDDSALEFDPASLRFDGRAVYASGFGDHPAPLLSPIAEGPGTGTLAEGSAASAPRIVAVAKDASGRHSVRDISTGDRLHGSAIGFRVAVGEAEARLSGLLAPHAPSHRGLYASERRRRTEKYALNVLDEEESEGEEEVDGAVGENNSGEKGALAIDKAKGKSQGKAEEKIKSTPNEPLFLASSVPARAQMMARRSSSALHHDATSGFELEPKTSLPYQEKLLTPSLRKAMRTHTTTPSFKHRPSLGAISDTSDNTTGSASVQQRQEQAAEMTAGGKAIPRSASSKQPDFQYSVPASVTRGFDMAMFGVKGKSEEGAAASLATAPKLGSPRLPAVPITATAAAMSPFSQSVQSSPMLASSADTGRSSRLRSPRPPYVQPPPPPTTDMRLAPDEHHRPQSIALADTTRAEEEGRLSDVLLFMHTVENLKTFKRTGWYHHRIERPESIADHMYRMALLSMLLPAADLDIGRCVQLCLVHDLAEALVGDLTPLDGVSREEKLRREHDAIQHLVHDQLDGSEVGLRIEALWNEYEERQTNESRAVKDLDRFELALQAVEYERRNKTADLQPFYSSAKDIRQPRIQGWMLGLAKEREHLWKDTDYSYRQIYPTAEQDGDQTL